MNVLQNVVIDMLNPRKTIIHVVQGDNARGVELTLLAGNAPFDVSSDLETGEALNNYVEFRKPDGHGGTYDHTSLGVQAVTQKTGTTNVWILAFDTECFSVPGWTQINVRFETNTGRVLQTFALCADVEPSAGVNEGSGDWDNTGGFNDQVKAALLNLLDHVEYTDGNKDQYLAELANAMYRPHGVTYISAVFDSGGETIYDTDTLDSLRQFLTVTAHWEDGTSEDVLSYTLSGTLTEGTSTITVAYSGKTTTFTVNVVKPVGFIPWDSPVAAGGGDSGTMQVIDHRTIKWTPVWQSSTTAHKVYLEQPVEVADGDVIELSVVDVQGADNNQLVKFHIGSTTVSPTPYYGIMTVGSTYRYSATSAGVGTFDYIEFKRNATIPSGSEDSVVKFSLSINGERKF